MQLVRIIAAALFLLCTRAVASAMIIFVDGSLPDDCSARYDPSTRNCGGGTYRAYRSIKGAADVALSGDTVILRAGTYTEQLAPRHSGTATTPIIYSNYIGEQVVITGAALAPAIRIYRTSYIIIQGIIVADVQRWLAVLGSHHITIRSNAFTDATDAGGSSKTGLFFQGSDYNVIRDNIIDNSTQDNIALVQSNHNLVEGNRITRAAHTLWTIKCGNYNVLRNNYFHNQLQKIGEIYDCDNVGYGDLDFPKVTSLDDTRHNVVEKNVFAYTSTPVDRSPYAGIQHAGQHCIIRGNIFFHCIGPPIDLTMYADEARYNYGNRVYHNVFYDNGFGGISVSGDQGSGYVFADNTCRNNIFYRNHFVRHDARWDWYGTLDGKPVQIITGRTSDITFERNDLFDTTREEVWIIAYGERTSSSNPPPQPLSWWESNQTTMFKDNMQIDPVFADTATQDFHLKPESPMIDAGMFLTRTVGAGNSRTMVVDRGDYFRDGYGIEGLAGDTIQLERQMQTAVIVNVDYVTNTLTLNIPLTWTNGQGVSLKYHGSAPDIGAFEMVSAVGEVAGEVSTNSLVLHPNPTTGHCILTFSERALYTPRIEVINIYGQSIHSEPRRRADGQHHCTIDLSNQPSGVYMVMAEMDGEIVTRMCIRE